VRLPVLLAVFCGHRVKHLPRNEQRTSPAKAPKMSWQGSKSQFTAKFLLDRQLSADSGSPGPINSYIQAAHFSRSVWNRNTFSPPCETGPKGVAKGRPVALASVASVVINPTRQPVNFAKSVLPSAA
jgi:hypothetical protein